MNITEIRIKLMDDPQDRLQAFCSVTFDACFVVRDLKIIQGTKGSFVAMPSRKLSDRCGQCGNKNQLRAQYCNQCGGQLDQERATRNDNGRAKLYADIAHPINSTCREKIQSQVLAAFEEELVKAREPGYVCGYDDYGDDDYEGEDYSVASREQSAPRFVVANDQQHRIDDATPAHTGTHHHLTASRREDPFQHESSASRRNAINDDFGAGLD